MKVQNSSDIRPYGGVLQYLGGEYSLSEAGRVVSHIYNLNPLRELFNCCWGTTLSWTFDGEKSTRLGWANGEPSSEGSASHYANAVQP